MGFDLQDIWVSYLVRSWFPQHPLVADQYCLL
jgi:hypothetical protein